MRIARCGFAGFSRHVNERDQRAAEIIDTTMERRIRDIAEQATDEPVVGRECHPRFEVAKF